MKVIELIDYYAGDIVSIRENGKALYIGTTDNIPYKFIRREIIGFNLGDVDEHLTGMVIGI